MHCVVANRPGGDILVKRLGGELTGWHVIQWGNEHDWGQNVQGVNCQSGEMSINPNNF